VSIREKLFKIIDKYSQFEILVVGDIILDEYIWGKATRLSPEAPVPVLEVNKYSYIPGGAANVANNITSLGGKVSLLGVIGDDIQGTVFKDTISKTGIDYSGLIEDKTRPTTVKTRLIAHNHQQLARADREVKDPISKETQDKILGTVKSMISKIDLILLSDYAKGVLTFELVQNIIQLAKSKNKIVLVDPKGLDYSKYNGVDLITPNRLEAELATKSPSGTAPELLAESIYKNIKIENILITLGEDGILLYSDKIIKTLPAVTSEVYDVTGAGDSLISALALSIPASELDYEISVMLGNYAAGVAVRKTGTTAVTVAELKNIIEHDLMQKSLTTSKRVYTN